MWSTELGFRRDDVAVLCVVPVVVCGHLSGLFGAVYRLLRELMGIVVYVEFHDGSTSKLHSCHTSLYEYKNQSYMM